MNHRLFLLLLTLSFLAVACVGSSPANDDDAADDDDSAGDDDDSAGDDDDSAGDDDDSAGDDDDSAGDDDDSAGDDDDSASEEMQVENEYAYCGPDLEPLPTDNLSLNVTSAGSIAATQWNYTQGCCPQIEVTAVADAAASTITMNYSLYDDVCDCICGLDIGFDLVGIPAGSWTLLLPNGVSRTFTVN